MFDHWIGLLIPPQNVPGFLLNLGHVLTENKIVSIKQSQKSGDFKRTLITMPEAYTGKLM